MNLTNIEKFLTRILSSRSENRIAKFPPIDVSLRSAQQRPGVWPLNLWKGRKGGGEGARISRRGWPTHRTPVVRGTACRDRPIARPCPICLCRDESGTPVRRWRDVAGKYGSRIRGKGSSDNGRGKSIVTLL